MANYEASVKYINELTSKCDEVQAEVLAEILSQNAETEYLKRHGILHGCIDRETFKTNVPIITYEDIKSDILRIRDDKFSPILCAKPISELWRSTGTTMGMHKLFPVTEEEKRRRDLTYANVMPYIRRCIHGEDTNKGKTLNFLIARKESVTPSGLIICAGTTSYFKNFEFHKDEPYPNNRNTSPREAILCTDHFQSFYTQLLCGFYQRHDVTHVQSVLGSTLVWVIRFLKLHYSELCHDISSGTLSPKITDPSLRAYMINTFMQKPQPELAKFIQDTCSTDDESSWEGIYRKIWPNTKCLDGILTGSMTQYRSMLNYYAGGLPLLSLRYSSSEAELGFNLNPMCHLDNVSYTIMPNMAYFEFLPLDSSNPKPKTVDLANVEVGKEYELVVTNFCGLYRYPMGDVLSPTGFYNSTPQFRFVRRKSNVVLAMDMCQVTEVDLQSAIDRASSLLSEYNCVLVDYTTYVDTKKFSEHCVIYIELMVDMTQQLANEKHKEVMEQCCLAMEISLGENYRRCRTDGIISPLEIRVVSNGTFEKLRDYAISEGASFSQYKVPRCVNVLAMVDLLNSQAVSSHFSPEVPPSTE